MPSKHTQHSVQSHLYLVPGCLGRRSGGGCSVNIFLALGALSSFSDVCFFALTPLYFIFNNLYYKKSIVSLCVCGWVGLWRCPSRRRYLNESQTGHCPWRAGWSLHVAGYAEQSEVWVTHRAKRGVGFAMCGRVTKPSEARCGLRNASNNKKNAGLVYFVNWVFRMNQIGPNCVGLPDVNLHPCLVDVPYNHLSDGIRIRYLFIIILLEESCMFHEQFSNSKLKSLELFGDLFIPD